MPDARLHFRLRIVRTADGQLRIALEPVRGEPRYFNSFGALTRYLERRLQRLRPSED